ncbi:MAG: AAA family ATPase, partial [Anaerolineaceae bacterium]|nr:AAA family ATPase [Anaerolineaceae bacterium]
MTLCSNCGFDNPPGMRFCGNCGNRLPKKGSDTPASLAADQLGVMMGPDLLERFRKAGLEASGQRRNVTVLFVDMRGFSTLSQKIDGEVLFDFIQQYTAMLMNDVYKYDGMVDKLAGDGLMALFGAPIAQENNAERAVRAALDMQEDIARLGEHFSEAIDHLLQVRIGLNAGSVIVGGIGSDKLMNYTAIGDTVNLASRLEEAASPGSILVSESVFRQTKQIFDFEKIPPLTLKNIKGLVTAFQVMGLKAEPGSVRGLEGFQAPMIGRDAEFKLIKSVVQRLTRQRKGGVIWVTGEAGLGKSRLKEELKASVDADSVQVIEGQSLTYRKSIAYWIFQDLLRNYLGVSIDTPDQVIKDLLLRRVSTILPAKAPNMIPFLEHILALEITDGGAAQRIQFLDAEQLSHQIFIALRDLLSAESVRCPLLLILDDLHWVDEASLDLILQLIDLVQFVPLVIYGNTRPFDGGMLGKINVRAQKLLHDNFSSIHLGALHANESRQLFETLLTLPDLPADFHDLIIQRSAGVPFYLEEIIRMLIEENVIYRDNGRWQLAPETDILSIGVPENLQGLILARFDRLDMIQRRVLQISAVIGHQFSFPVLHGVLKYAPANSIESTLSFLVAHEYIVLQMETSEKNFTFKHALVSDAIYSTLLKRDRRELHGQVGQVIETLYADRLEGQVELLANHYFKSLMRDRALHYLILAGQKSERGYANEQARQYYEHAQGLLSEIEHTRQQELQIHRGLGDILVTIGEYQPARDHYQAGLEKISPEEKDDFMQTYCRLHRKIAVTFERQGDYEKSFARLKEVQQTLEAADEPLPIELARTLNEIGWTYFRRGDLERTETFLVRALNLVKDTLEYEVIASIYNRLGGVYFQR